MDANTTNTDNRIYRELCQLTKNKTAWNEKIPYVAALLENSTPKIVAKAMWMLGEMGLLNPQAIAVYTANDLPIFEKLLDDDNERVRMEAPEIFRVIGKRKPELVMSYLAKLEYVATHDTNKVVRIHAKPNKNPTLHSITQCCTIAHTMKHYHKL